MWVLKPRREAASESMRPSCPPPRIPTVAPSGRGSGIFAGVRRDLARSRRTPAKMPDPLPLGATVGILGGGQLGRMLSLAASRLGFKTHIYCPDPQSPAFEVTPHKTVVIGGDGLVRRDLES